MLDLRIKNSLMLIVFLICIYNLGCDNKLKSCDDIKWQEFTIKTDTSFSYSGKVKLVIIKGDIKNKINNKIIEALEIENFDNSSIINQYLLDSLEAIKFNPIIYNGYIEIVTQVQCENGLITYRIEKGSQGFKWSEEKSFTYEIKALNK